MKSRLAVAALLVVLLLQIVSATATKSATFDEAVHIFSGWRLLTQGDRATNHEHPPLMKALAAFPLLFMGVAPPRGQMRREADEWTVSHEFLYHVNGADRLLGAARLPVALLSVALAWAVWRHATATLGEFGGLTALALLVFEPNILAHSGLVTTDLGSTAFGFFTFAAFAAWLRRPTRWWLAATGVLLGLALLTRFTAMLLVPILVVCGGLHAYLEGRPRPREVAAALLLIGAIGLGVLNLGYGFGGTFTSLRGFTPESRRFSEHAAGPLGAVPLPLPVEYVKGFDHAEAGGQRWWSYLLGRHSMTGWRHYYLVALAVKTPLPLLLMTAGGLLLWPRTGSRGGERRAGEGDRLRAVDALLPQVPLLVYLAAFILSGNLKNIGLRYILPIYPFMCLIAALLTRVDFHRVWRTRVVCALLVWQAGAALLIYPDYLTYFNPIVGGPSRGSEVLLDSNLDWGQDLKGLGRYIRDHRIEKIYVDYFGRACLRYYGVRSTPDFEGGYIAVSATHLKGVYDDRKDRYRFLWDAKPVTVIGRSIFVYDVPRPEGFEPRSAAPGD